MGIIDPLLFNGEYGKLVVHHNIPYEKHRFWQEDGVANTLSEWRSSVIEGNTKLDRKQIEIVARKLAKEDPGISPAQLMTKIKYLFPNTDLIPKKIIHNAISHWRWKIMPLMNEKAMSISVEHIKTLRKTPFGRGSSFWMVDGRPKHFLYMYSDFQMQVANEVKDDPFLHLFIDGTFKWWPRLWSQLLNVWVLHRKKNQYIPIAHILMQTETYEGYFKVINWIKDTFGLTPKFITTDFEISLMRATKEILADSQIVPWFFHFAKCLWNNAGKCGLKKNKLLVLTKQLIFSLKGLAFRPPNKVYRRFEFIKNKFLDKGNWFKQFLEYFESTWMDGTFQIKDWNYYDKLNEFEDLALTNNGLESFHQMIRSQLRRSQPNLFYLVDLLGRVETMKKAAYDEDKIKGDPQFNRCWPASKIFRELYSKEYENISNKLICKEMNENNLNKSQSNSLNNENEFYPDYWLSELESLKKTNIPDYHSKRSTIEKEVLILFNEFDEENRLPHTDKGIQQLCKQRRELEDEIKTKDEKNYNMTMAESLVLNDKPSISHEMELIKNEWNKKGSRRYYEPLTSLNYNPNALDIFDDKDMDVKNILEGSYSIKTNFNYAE